MPHDGIKACDGRIALIYRTIERLSFSVHRQSVCRRKAMNLLEQEETTKSSVLSCPLPFSLSVPSRYFRRGYMSRLRVSGCVLQGLEFYGKAPTITKHYLCIHSINLIAFHGQRMLCMGLSLCFRVRVAEKNRSSAPNITRILSLAYCCTERGSLKTTLQTHIITSAIFPLPLPLNTTFF